MEDDNELTPKQVRAIKLGVDLGKTFQNKHPEIVGLYRNGYSLSEIREELDIPSKYGVSERVARAGVHRAIIGHNGNLGIEAYDGLISEEERERIGREHRLEGSRIVGCNTRDGKKGIHGRTVEQRFKDGSKGGKISGSRVYENGIGIHGRSSEQMEEDGRKAGLKAYEKKVGIHAQTSEEKKELGREAGRKSAIANGLTLWTEEEREFIYQLSLDPDYQMGSQVNAQLIATELNKKYYDGDEVRTAKTTQAQLYKYRRSLEDRV